MYQLMKPSSLAAGSRLSSQSVVEGLSSVRLTGKSQRKRSQTDLLSRGVGAFRTSQISLPPAPSGDRPVPHASLRLAPLGLACIYELLQPVHDRLVGELLALFAEATLDFGHRHRLAAAA